MKAILRSINNFSCKLKQSNNLKYNISPKIRSNKFKSISGNGNVVLEDTLNKNLKDYRVYGNTYQNTTSGKNLLGITANSNNGITSVINSDGSITYSGTATSTWANITQRFYKDLPSGTYILSINKVMDYRVAIRLYYEDGTYQPFVIYAGDTSRIFTATQNIKSYYIYISNTLTVGQEYNDTLYVQLEEGSTATEFEPYTGGQPSPNPDYPQEIVSCGDRTGNLLDTNGSQEGYITADGSIITSHANLRLTTYIKIPDNTSNLTQSCETGYAMNIPAMCFFNANKEYISGVAFENAIEKTFIVPNNAVYIRTCYRTTASWNMLNTGSTATSYEPFGKYKIPVNVRSENLFNISEITSVTNGTLSNNIITTNTSGSAANFNVSPIFPQKKLLSGHTYYLSAEIRIKSGTGSFGKINDYVADWTRLISPTISDVFQKYIFTKTFTADTSYYRFLFQFRNVNNAVFEIKNIMLSEVNEDYQPYYNETTNIYLDEPLRGIGEYSDYIDFINGKVVRNIDEIILNGSENWAKSSRTVVNRYYIMNVIHVHYDKYTIDLISDYFKCISPQSSDNVSIGLAKYNANGFMINFELTNTNFDTLSKFVSWLQSNNVTVDYVLATPTEENIELPNINLIEGKNIITIGTELESIIEVEYYSKEIIDISDYKYDLRKVED